MKCFVLGFVDSFGIRRYLNVYTEFALFNKVNELRKKGFFDFTVEETNLFKEVCVSKERTVDYGKA